MTHRKRPQRSIEKLEDRRMLSADDPLANLELEPLDPTAAEVRSIDGTDNNLDDPTQGAANTNLIRFGYPAVYPDGFGDEIDIGDRPDARTISNVIHDQDESTLNDRFLTDWVFQWGQFLTHDMDLTTNGTESNTLSDGTVGDFSIPVDDPTDVLGPGPITFNRSIFDPATGNDDVIASPFGDRLDWREQINLVTSYIDASNVYGSDDARALALRTLEGGKLATTDDGLLPALNSEGLPNDDPFGLGEEAFLAGDVRANEQIGLTATHSLFVREHNRLADLIAEENPTWSDEEIYQLARRIVSAEMQIITYNEFLPAVLGPDAAPDATDAVYSSDVNAAITNSFATAIFRFGHSMISPEMLLVNNEGDTEGSVSIIDAFFNPDFLKDNPENVDLLLKGLSSQLAQENDVELIDGIRNTLFGPGAGGTDLAALDIQRGRDHGLPDYNALREFYGLERVGSIDEISSDPEIQQKLKDLYGDDVDNIDAFVGALAEDHLPGSSVGELVSQVMVDQFTRLRDGDRFFYTNDPVLSSRFVTEVIDLDEVSLSNVIQSNTGITDLQDNVFFDESVLMYQSDNGDRPANVRVVVGPENVALVNGRTGKVIESRPIGEVSQVLLLASDARRDVFTVDMSRAGEAIPGGIVVNGGDGPRDILNVIGRRGPDTIVVDAQNIDVNGQGLDYSGFETVHIYSGGDGVQVVDDSGAKIVVHANGRGDGGHDHDGHQGPQAPHRDDRGLSGGRDDRDTGPGNETLTPDLEAAIDTIFTGLGRRRR